MAQRPRWLFLYYGFWKRICMYTVLEYGRSQAAPDYADLLEGGRGFLVGCRFWTGLLSLSWWSSDDTVFNGCTGRTKTACWRIGDRARAERYFFCYPTLKDTLLPAKYTLSFHPAPPRWGLNRGSTPRVSGMSRCALPLSVYGEVNSILSITRPHTLAVCCSLVFYSVWYSC